LERVYSFEKNEKGKLEKILSENPYDKLSFARVEYIIKEKDRIYLYINADEEFFKFAEEKLKALESFKRESEEKEKEIIEEIKRERESSISGFGGIFG
jgi:hypothetical protein